MSGLSALAFGITTVVLAVAGWMGFRSGPEEEAGPPPYTLRTEDVSITAVLREVDGKESHLFLITTGSGRGSISVRFEVNRGLTMGRVVDPHLLSEKTIAYDQDGGSRKTDLGPVPENPYGDYEADRMSRQVVATTDNASYVTIWTENPKVDELVEQAGYKPRNWR